PGNATSGKISVTTAGGTATSANDFVVAPRITSFMPTRGAVNTDVTITGSNFTGASAVKFNGSAGTVSTVTASAITVTVPATATSGKISVTTPAGTAVSAGSFLVTPGITSFSPATGAANATVIITGTALTGATAVRFNGLGASFHVDSNTQITA